MDKESLVTLINKTRENIKAFEEKIFKELNYRKRA